MSSRTPLEIDDPPLFWFLKPPGLPQGNWTHVPSCWKDFPYVTICKKPSRSNPLHLEQYIFFRACSKRVCLSILKSSCRACGDNSLQNYITKKYNKHKNEIVNDITNCKFISEKIVTTCSARPLFLWLIISFNAGSLFTSYEAWTLIELCVQHWHDTDTYDYIKLYHFLKLSVSTCQCRIRCMCPCFIVYKPMLFQYIK
jgi:hypothetical protein